MRRAIDVGAPISAGSADVADVLRRGAAALFSDRYRSGLLDEAPTEFRGDLHFGGPVGSVHHNVAVHLADDPEGGASRTCWRMTVQPERPGRLLPSFEGTIAVVEEGGGPVVRVRGTYEPPLGMVGAFGDGLVGFRIARRSLESFVREIAERVDRAVESGAFAGRGSAPQPTVDLCDVAAVSENWLG